MTAATAADVLDNLFHAWHLDIESVPYPLFDHLPAVLEGQR